MTFRMTRSRIMTMASTPPKLTYLSYQIQSFFFIPFAKVLERKKNMTSTFLWTRFCLLKPPLTERKKKIIQSCWDDWIFLPFRHFGSILVNQVVEICSCCCLDLKVLNMSGRENRFTFCPYDSKYVLVNDLTIFLHNKSIVIFLKLRFLPPIPSAPKKLLIKKNVDGRE